MKRLIPAGALAFTSLSLLILGIRYSEWSMAERYGAAGCLFGVLAILAMIFSTAP